MTEELVIQKPGKDVTTSFIVSEVFEKEHKNILRDIENLHCSKGFHQLNFELLFIIRELPNGGRKDDPYYEITRDGFSFLVMGYTGEKAGEFKEKFLNAFNKLEALLRDDDYTIARAHRILSAKVKLLKEKTLQLEAKIEEQQPMADAFAITMDSTSLFPMGDVAKILYPILHLGRNELFAALRNKKILMSNNTPYQNHIDAVHFVVKEFTITTKSGNKMLKKQTFVPQQGIVYILKTLTKNNS